MMKIILRKELRCKLDILKNASHQMGGIRLLKTLGFTVLFAGFSMAQNESPGRKKVDRSSLVRSQAKPAQAVSPEVAPESGIKSDSPFDAVKGKKEEAGKRDLYTKHYVNEDGSYTAFVATNPVHYLKNGQYFDIDPAIAAHTEVGSAYAFANKTNVLESYFGATAHQGIKSRTSEGEMREFLNARMYWEVNGQALNTLSSADVPVSIQNDRAYYNHLYGNIHAEFIALAGKRKLNYIIPSAQDLGSVPQHADYLVFTEDIVLPLGWTYAPSESGILIQDAAGKNVYTYERPYSTDATDALPEDENTVFETQLNGNTLTIKTKVKVAWLLDSDRQFPVKVDPTVNAWGNVTGAISSSGFVNFTGQLNDVISGLVNVSGTVREINGYAKFTVSSIPAGSVITSAVTTARIYVNSTYSANGHAWSSCTIDPQLSTAANLFNEGVTLYWQATSYSGGVNGTASTQTLNATAISALQGSLTQGWFAMLMYPVGNAWDFSYPERLQLWGQRGTTTPASGTSQRPYLVVTYTVPVAMTCATLTNLAATLGSPVNGVAHYLSLNWNALTGATGYDVQFSTDGSTYANATPASVSTNSFSFNAGDSPNTRYWFRVRAKDANQTCDWTYATPIYTAADIPAIPLLSNAVGNSLDLTLQTEAPVANPSITTYSIVCSNTGQFVQANDTLGATEVFRTKAEWGTISVNGLLASTEYCFYAKAKNGDGHVVSGGTNISGTETFQTNGNFSALAAAPTNKWWTPPTPTSGTPMAYNASGGNCSDGYVGFSGSNNNFYGSFLRSPQLNCTGLNEVTLTFDLSNSYHAAQPLDRIYFNMWAPTAAAPSGGYVNAATVDGVSTHILNFSEVRTCKRITVTFNLSTVTNKSAIMFYLNVNCGYNNANVFSFKLDNISVSEKAPTACIITASAPTPIFHHLGGSQQIIFDNARYNEDKPIFRLSHYGTSAATSYQIEMNTKSDFTGTSIVQTFAGNYPAQTPANFTFSNAENQLVDQTTYYARARINIGSGYGLWSAKLHSYTYDTGKSVPSWFQTTTPQFLTDELIGTIALNDYTTVAAASGGGSGNAFTDPSFETGQNWSTKASYSVYQTTLVSNANANGTNGITDGSMCVKFAEDDYSWQGFFNGEYNNVSQQVDLTGVGEIKFDLTHWRNTQSTMYSCGVGRACKVVWSFKVIIGNAGTSNDNSGTEVYTWTPTTAEFGVTNKVNETIDLSAYGFTGLKTVKFARVVTDGGGSWYDDDKYYLDNIRTGAGNLQTSGTIISTPVRLASVQGAVGYKELVWNQELAGGSVRFDLQSYNTTTSLWETVNGFGGIQDPSSNGEKSFDLESANFPSHDSIRIVGHLTGNTSGIRLNDWAIFFTYPQTPLPVTLTSFAATCERDVQLSWSTASEQNSDVFVLEKSRNLVDWIFVSSQAAAGNSSVNKNYVEHDEDPWNEVAYYRLRQLDFNGQEQVYGPISVFCDAKESGVKVYPNPNQGDFTIEVSSAEILRDVQVSITDLAGKEITSRTLDIQAGTTQIPFENLGLQMGTYLVQFHGTGKQLKPVKVVVNR